MTRHSPATSRAELLMIAEYSLHGLDEYIRAASRADNGRDPAREAGR